MMAYRLLLLLASLHVILARPTMEDNMLPTDEEVLASLMEHQRAREGQPELETPLGLPTDEESYNALQQLFSTGDTGSGTQHFVSSSFPEMDARGFHESVFDGLGDFYPRRGRKKRDPFGINARGFHDDVFHQEFGRFNPMKRAVARWIPYFEVTGNGNYRSAPGDTPTYQRFKRDVTASPQSQDSDDTDLNKSKTLPHETPEDILGDEWQAGAREALVDNRNIDEDSLRGKRRMGSGQSGFHGDTFSGGFGDFATMKRTEDKRRMGSGQSGFHGDTFSGGFGDFATMKKRRPDMDSSGFHGDTFNGGFGDFDIMKKQDRSLGKNDSNEERHSYLVSRIQNMLGRMEHKRRPEMNSLGIYGDTFNNGFQDFDIMKKRRPDMDSMGFHGDTFNGGFGDFDIMKRRPEMDSMGFHGDTFNGGFGNFDIMKKSPVKSQGGLRGEESKSGAGDSWTMKKRSLGALNATGVVLHPVLPQRE